MKPFGKDNMQYLALAGRVVPRDLAGHEPDFMVHQVSSLILHFIFKSSDFKMCQNKQEKI